MSQLQINVSALAAKDVAALISAGAISAQQAAELVAAGVISFGPAGDAHEAPKPAPKPKAKASSGKAKPKGKAKRATKSNGAQRMKVRKGDDGEFIVRDSVAEATVKGAAAPKRGWSDVDGYPCGTQFTAWYSSLRKVEHLTGDCTCGKVVRKVLVPECKAVLSYGYTEAMHGSKPDAAVPAHLIVSKAKAS